MTTTPSTASQAPAVSILQDHEFMRALEAFADTFPRSGKEALIDLGKKSDYALIQIIDAKLAQAREDRDFAIKVMAENMAMIGEVLGVDEDEGGPTAILEAIERLHAGWADQIGKTREAEVRATAAEAKLEAIRQGLENLDRYDADYQRGDGVWLVAKGAYIDRADALAILKHPQADESGLTG